LKYGKKIYFFLQMVAVGFRARFAYQVFRVFNLYHTPITTICNNFFIIFFPYFYSNPPLAKKKCLRSQTSFWANVFLDKCLSGQTSFWANFLWSYVFMGKCILGQISLWANVLMDKRLLGKHLLGKCLYGLVFMGKYHLGKCYHGQTLYGQMSLPKCLWANVVRANVI
jgi:hypothetical protein